MADGIFADIGTAVGTAVGSAVGPTIDAAVDQAGGHALGAVVQAMAEANAQWAQAVDATNALHGLSQHVIESIHVEEPTIAPDAPAVDPSVDHHVALDGYDAGYEVQASHDAYVAHDDAADDAAAG